MFINVTKFPKLAVIPTIAIVWVSIMVGSVYAEETITVKLQSGRKFTAQVDARSSPQKLWLRFGNEGMTLLRPVAWDQVAWATYNGQKMDGLELRAQVLVLALKTLKSNKATAQASLKHLSDQSMVPRDREAVRGEHE